MQEYLQKMPLPHPGFELGIFCMLVCIYILPLSYFCHIKLVCDNYVAFLIIWKNYEIKYFLPILGSNPGKSTTFLQSKVCSKRKNYF